MNPMDLFQQPSGADRSLEERTARGHEARRLLENALIREALAQAKYDAIEASLTAPTVEEREAARARMHGVEDVERQLRAIMDDGEHADAVLRRTQ